MTTDQSDDSREQGVEFGSLAEELEDETYPLDKAELLERYGDHELVLEDDMTALGAVLEPLGEDEFESADDVRQSVLTMVSDEAIGRENYSDRGGETDTDESQESM